MSASRDGVVVGLDLGTSGARAVALDAAGQVVAEGACELPPPAALPEGRFEQEPATWWEPPWWWPKW